MRYELIEPIKGTSTGGAPVVLYEALELRLPTPADAKAMLGLDGIDANYRTIARLSGVDEAILRGTGKLGSGLGLEDFQALDIITDALFAGARTKGSERAEAWLKAAGLTKKAGTSEKAGDPSS